MQYLKNDCLYGNDDPLFPKTNTGQNSDNNFEAVGLSREHWQSAAAIRKVFKQSFALAELSYFNPHIFRNTLAALGESLCQTPEEFKAWSQNLGHEGVLTTFYSYGEVQDNRQADIFKGFDKPRVTISSSVDVTNLAKALKAEMGDNFMRG